MINRLRTWWENLDENIKQMILIIVFVIVVIILAYAIFVVFFKPAPPATETGLPTEISLGTLPSPDIRQILEERGITLEEGQPPRLQPSELRPDAVARGGRTIAEPVVNINAQDVAINTTGDIHYYDRESEQFYRLNANGFPESLSQKSFPNVENVEWSPTATKGILEFPDGKNIFYDFDSETQYTLPDEGQDFSFSPSGSEISYEFITNNPDENWLVVSDPTGANAIAVEHIGEANPDDVITSWSPDSSKVGFYRASAGITSEEVIVIGKNQENFKSLPVNGRGFEGLWSPQSDYLLYTVYNEASGYRPELFVTNARDDNLGVHNKSLGIYTWTSKCVFAKDNTTAYCAVPLYITQGAGIYPQVAAQTPDIIYKLNIQTGFKQQIAIPTNSLGITLYTAEKLLLSGNEDTLMMVDTSGGIYNIALE